MVFLTSILPPCDEYDEWEYVMVFNADANGRRGFTTMQNTLTNVKLITRQMVFITLLNYCIKRY